MSDKNSLSTPITRISMIEDDVDIRNTVSQYIGMHEEFEMTKIFGSVEAFLYQFKIEPEFNFEILLLDVGLPGISGTDAIPQILEKMPELDIIMLTTYEEEEVILKALCSGACSYLSKKSSLPNIVEALRIVAKGGSYMSPSIAREIVQYLMGGQLNKMTTLTERQKEVLKALSEGKSYRQIAENLFISIETVRSHIKKLYKQLQVNNKSAAISLYLKGKIK